MHFIVSSTVDKFDPATRRLIRSHAMRGRKQPKGKSTYDQRKTSKPKDSANTPVEMVGLGDVTHFYTPLIPQRVGSDVSFIECADEMELSMFLNVVKVSDFAMQVMFPLLFAVGARADQQKRLYPFARDPANLHIVAYTVETFIDKILLRKDDIPNIGATLHFQKGLGILQERLRGEDNASKTSDETINAVAKLASTAHFFDDFKGARQHMEGLRKMVELRGGMDVFLSGELGVELLRCDLNIALLNISSPTFFDQQAEQLLKYPQQLLPSADDKVSLQESVEWIGIVDQDLAKAWHAMRKFCLFVNLGVEIGRPIRQDLVHETMAAVMYRLLQMEFAADSIDYAVRYGLLAFTYHIFLQWKDVKLPRRHFSSVYRGLLPGFERINGASSQLLVWLLMLGAISIFEISEEALLRECLGRHVKKSQVRTWKDMQALLKSFMWIDMLDDQPGKNIYYALQQEI